MPTVAVIVDAYRHGRVAFVQRPERIGAAPLCDINRLIAGSVGIGINPAQIDDVFAAIE